MGEAKEKEAATAAAAQRLAAGRAQPTAAGQAAALLIDMAANTVNAASILIGNNLRLAEVADELAGVVAHLQKIRTRLLGEPARIVVAPAGSVPRIRARDTSPVIPDLQKG